MIEQGQGAKLICPRCGAPELRRTRRIGRHRILKFIPSAKLYKCRDCHKVALFILGRRIKVYR